MKKPPKELLAPGRTAALASLQSILEEVGYSTSSPDGQVWPHLLTREEKHEQMQQPKSLDKAFLRALREKNVEFRMQRREMAAAIREARRLGQPNRLTAPGRVSSSNSIWGVGAEPMNRQAACLLFCGIQQEEV